MAKHRFRVFHINTHDHISTIEMDDSLLAPAAGIIDPVTQTLRPIKNGGVYTLIPIEDHKIAVLKRVKEVFNNVTNKPAKMFSTHISRMDELILAVDLLFGKVKYTVVENVNDISNIINPPKDPDFEYKYVEYDVISDLLNGLNLEDENAVQGSTETS